MTDEDGGDGDCDGDEDRSVVVTGDGSITGTFCLHSEWGGREMVGNAPH